MSSYRFQHCYPIAGPRQ